MFKRPYTRPLYLSIVLLVVIGLALSSCAASRATQSPSYDMSSPGAAPQEAPAYSGSTSGSGGFTSNVVEPAKADRLVVKNASLSFASNDPEASMNRISKMAEDMGGFVVTARVYQSSLSSGVQVTQASVNVRVPAERLNEAMDTIRKEASQPEITENINSEDVTAAYTDLQSRLRNLEAAEKQLQAIMETTTDTTNVLAVYNQLVSVREQIEVIKGQMQYYEQSAALSSISVELLANESVQPLTIAGWKPGGVAKDAIQATINAFQFLANAVIVIVLSVLPILAMIFVMILLPLYLLFRLLRWLLRRNRKPAPPAPTPAQG